MFNRLLNLDLAIYPFKIARKKIFNISLRKISSKIYYSLMKLRFNANSSKNKLDFDWSSLNFNRTALLNFIIANHPKKIKCNYLEIGCASNINFDSICLKNKVGVDPDMGGTLRLTSDDYFSKYKESKFDLIFLDGLHTYKQTKKDLLNALDVLNDGGIIVLDDFIPRDWMEHFTPRVQTQWNGDIWKISFELLNAKGIEFKILTIDGGQCVIFRKNEKTFLPDYYEDFKDLNFDYLYENFSRLPITNLEEGLNWIKESLE